LKYGNFNLSSTNIFFLFEIKFKPTFTLCSSTKLFFQSSHAVLVKFIVNVIRQKQFTLILWGVLHESLCMLGLRHKKLEDYEWYFDCEDHGNIVSCMYAYFFTNEWVITDSHWFLGYRITPNNVCQLLWIFCSHQLDMCIHQKVDFFHSNVVR
jgi:hypothetical protein